MKSLTLVMMTHYGIIEHFSGDLIQLFLFQKYIFLALGCILF